MYRKTGQKITHGGNHLAIQVALYRNLPCNCKSLPVVFSGSSARISRRTTAGARGIHVTRAEATKRLQKFGLTPIQRARFVRNAFGLRSENKCDHSIHVPAFGCWENCKLSWCRKYLQMSSSDSDSIYGHVECLGVNSLHAHTPRGRGGVRRRCPYASQNTQHTPLENTQYSIHPQNNPTR